MHASVIILVWNGIAFLSDCLQAVTHQDIPDYEVIVVDNGSTDGSADFVAARFPNVHLIRNERNLGYSAGNNIGLRAAVGDLLVLLNQDTIVREDWLRALSHTFAMLPSAGIVGSKALFSDGRIQHAGGIVDAQGNGSHLGYRLRDSEDFNVRRDVDYVTGAALAMSREAFAATGELDEQFLHAYFEDVDLCYRVRANGFGVHYEPAAVLVHMETSVAADGSHEGMFLFQRNRLRFVLKHWSLNRLVKEFMPAERQWLADRGAYGEPLVAAMHHAYLNQLLHLDDLVDWRRCHAGAAPFEAEQLEAVLITLRTFVPLRMPRLDYQPKKLSSIGSISDRAVRRGSASPAALVPLAPPPRLPESILSPTKLPGAPQIAKGSFHSKQRIIGRFITAFVHGLDHLSNLLDVGRLAAQQESFNVSVLNALEHMSQQILMLSSQTQQQAKSLSEWNMTVELHITSVARELAVFQRAWEPRLAEVQAELGSDLCKALEIIQVDGGLHAEALERERRRLEDVVAAYFSENGREFAELAHEIRNLRARLADGE